MAVVSHFTLGGIVSAGITYSREGGPVWAQGAESRIYGTIVHPEYISDCPDARYVYCRIIQSI